jgi:NADH-quinone oxidoreductase subunit N
MTPELSQSLRSILPEIALTAGLLLVVLVDALRPPGRNLVLWLLCAGSLAVSMALAVLVPVTPGLVFSGMLAVDPTAIFFKVLLAGAGLLVTLAFTFRNSRELAGLGQGEFYALLLAVTMSSMLLAGASDLAMVYLALEMVSIGSYVMVAYLKGDSMSNEASLKYLLFGAVSTGAMLYGFSLLYGLTGTTSLAGIRDVLAGGLPAGARGAVYVITLLVFAGFGFKMAVVPFHFWCPDVYQGAPTPVTAYLSVAPKAAGFAVALRFFFGGLSSQAGSPWELTESVDWPQLLMVLSAVTMTVGNVAALTQTNMKRLLAYSSIAHAGYVMMGLVALSENGARGMLVYLFCYLLMNLGAFLVVMLVHHHDGTFDLRDWPGLYRRAPGLTAAMAVFMLSLMGIPPLVGFMGKLYVFAALVERGSAYYWLAMVGAVNAAVAAFYYARVLKTMIIDAGNEEKPPLRLAFADSAFVTALALANFVPVLFWSLVETWTSSSLVLWAGR